MCLVRLYPGVTPFLAVWLGPNLAGPIYSSVMGQGCLPLAHVMRGRLVGSDMAALCKIPAADSQKTLGGNQITCFRSSLLKQGVCKRGLWEALGQAVSAVCLQKCLRSVMGVWPVHLLCYRGLGLPQGQAAPASQFSPVARGGAGRVSPCAPPADL